MLPEQLSAQQHKGIKANAATTFELQTHLWPSHLDVVGRVPVDVVQHQVRRSDQIQPHPAGFRAQEKQEVLRIGAVKAVNQSLPLARWSLTI